MNLNPELQTCIKKAIPKLSNSSKAPASWAAELSAVEALGLKELKAPGLGSSFRDSGQFCSELGVKSFGLRGLELKVTACKQGLILS